MRFLFVRAYMKLVFFDLVFTRGSFDVLYEKIRTYPIAAVHPTQDTVERICNAVDMAAIWYCKKVLCLQRAAATACLLRKRGLAAKVVIAAQQLPFKPHAWVEVDGQVVNDKPYMREVYSVVDCC
jgi:hypothetical protein